MAGEALVPRSGAAAPAPAAGGAAAGAGGAPGSDDAALVARVRMGDESACEALYRAYHDRLWRFAWSHVRSRDVAEEIVQEVFLALWRGRGEWDVRTSARAWLYASVRNQALNHVRHERVVARLVVGAADAAPASADAAAGEAPGMGEPPPDAQRMLEERELDATVLRALASLPERRRAAMTLRWKHDLTAPEIARVLSTTPESVRVLLTRARQDLAGLLSRLRRPGGE